MTHDNADKGLEAGVASSTKEARWPRLEQGLVLERLEP